MAKVGEILVQVLVDSKQGVKEIQKFGKVVSTVSTTSAKNFGQVQQAADRLKRFQFETNRITLQDYKSYLEKRLKRMKQATAEEKIAYGKVQDEIRQLDRTASQSKGMTGLANRIKQNWISIAATVAGVSVALNKVLNAASDLEEAQGKFDVVFDGMRDRAIAWREELVESFAMSRREATQYLSAVQDLLVPMGMAKDAAGEMSFQVTKLAADLGSFNNLPTKQVIDDMQSALVGNFETMKKYGVVLNETTVKQEAMRLGLFSGKGVIDAAARAQAAYSLIVKGSTAAIGDMARTSESYANIKKRVSARIEDLTAKLGETFLPVAADVLNMFGVLVEFLRGLEQGTLKFGLTVAALAAALWKVIPAIRAIDAATKVLGVSVKGALGWVGLIVTAITVLYSAWSTNIFGMQNVLKSAWAWIKAVFQSLWEVIKSKGRAIVQVIRGLLQAFDALRRRDFSGIKKAYANTMQAMAEDTAATKEKIAAIWEQARNEAEKSEKAQTTSVKSQAAKRRQIRTAEAKKNMALLEKQQQEAKVLAELRIANIEDEFARRRARADAAYAEQRQKYRDNSAILLEIEKQHARKIAEINAAERQQRQAAEERHAQKQAELARRLEDLKIAAIADGLARREAEIEAQFRRELEKWQGNAEAVLAIEQRKQQALAELARQRREAEQQAQERQWQNWQQQNALWLNTARAGYGTFLSTILDAEMSAAEKRTALFNSMRDAFVNSLQAGLNKLIEVKLRETVVHTTAETTKTTVTQTQTAARSSISLAAIAKEIGRVLVSVGAWLAQLTAKLFSWFASMGPLGILAGLGAVPALIASVKAMIKSAAKFKDGGVVKEQIFGLIGEAGDSEAVIPLNARGAEFMAQLVPQITVPVPVVIGAGGGITSEEFSSLKEDMVAAIRDIRIEIRSELDALQFFRDEFPNYEKAERERRL